MTYNVYLALFAVLVQHHLKQGDDYFDTIYHNVSVSSAFNDVNFVTIRCAETRNWQCLFSLLFLAPSIVDLLRWPAIYCRFAALDSARNYNQTT